MGVKVVANRMPFLHLSQWSLTLPQDYRTCVPIPVSAHTMCGTHSTDNLYPLSVPFSDNSREGGTWHIFKKLMTSVLASVLKLFILLGVRTSWKECVCWKQDRLEALGAICKLSLMWKQFWIEAIRVLSSWFGFTLKLSNSAIRCQVPMLSLKQGFGDPSPGLASGLRGRSCNEEGMWQLQL